MNPNKPLMVIVSVIAGWCVYVLLLPFISPIMRKLFPGLWQCQYNRITGKACPFCGITRDMHTFYSAGSFGTLNDSSHIYFMVFMGTVIVISILAIFMFFRSRSKGRSSS